MARKKELAELVKTLREARGLTQAELAEKAEISREYVALMEIGAKKNPTIVVLKKLAKALGVAVGDLLE
jgi:transcriptional regulator with XRE-family HTH domain